MSIRYLGVQTYAGGFDIGATQAGLQLVGRIENKGGFGIRQCETNRRILGDAWESQVGEPSTWEPLSAEIILSNPPCSGFSSMTYGSAFNGIDSRINSCMWDSIRYAGKVSPYVFVMESVQGAAVKGLPLMRQLRVELERLTGHRYDMYHVLQNNGALGGASRRRRYFLVLSRVPFGVELPEFGPPPTLFETIGDLEPLDYRTWEAQPYLGEQSSWVRRECASLTGKVDGHVTAEWETPGVQRLVDLMTEDGDGQLIWPQGKCLVVALRNYYAAHGKLPDSWHFQRQKSKRWADEALIENDMEMGFTRPRRWEYDKVAYVILGGAMYLVIHPTQDRLLTHRECARIMGFPDDWVAAPLQGLRGLEEGWGKGTSTHPARWIAHWARQAVLEEPGSFRGTATISHRRLEHHGSCDREWVIDVSRVPTQQPLTSVQTVEEQMLESVA